MSTIDTALDAGARTVYKAQTLLSCLSSDTLKAVLAMTFTDAQLDDHTVVITHLRARCNAGRNRHIWRQQFSSKRQGVQQAADDWLCELRDLTRKCEFATDCCANCEPTRILGQVVSGVYSDKVRVKLLEQGATLSLYQALAILRTAEASNRQSRNLKHVDAVAIQATMSSDKWGKQQLAAEPYDKHKPTGRLLLNRRQLTTTIQGAGIVVPDPVCAFYNPGHLKVKSAVSVQFLTIMLEFVEIQKLVLLSSKVSTAPPAVGAVTDATPNDDRKRAYFDQLMRMAGDFLWPVPTNGWSTLHLKDDAQPVAMRGLAQYQYRSCQK